MINFLLRWATKVFTILFTLTVMLPSVIGCESSTTAPLTPQSRLRIATTTSLYDTGLWGYLEPMFEEQYEVELDIISTGTGAALEYGRRGDVDVITVHSKIREEEFVSSGYGIERIPFAYNYFLIVGPSNDPAGIQGVTPEDAFRTLFETGNSTFVSRGDDSGTHTKEKYIWKAAGYDYESVKNIGQWYIEGGRGMGLTLLMASEKQGYTLTDMGTFLSYKGQISLVPIVDKASILLNVYSVIVCNPDINPKVAVVMGNNMVQFLTSADVQELIGNYGVEVYGMQLFKPCAGNEPSE